MINTTYEGLPTAARNVAHVVDFKIAVPLDFNESIEDQSQWLRDQDHQTKSTGLNVTSQLINLELQRLNQPKQTRD